MRRQRSQGNPVRSQSRIKVRVKMPQGGNQGNRGAECRSGTTEEAGEKEVAGTDAGCAGEAGDGPRGQGGGPVMAVVDLSPKGLVAARAAALALSALSAKARLSSSVWMHRRQARPTARVQASSLLSSAQVKRLHRM